MMSYKKEKLKKNNPIYNCKQKEYPEINLTKEVESMYTKNQ